MLEELQGELFEDIDSRKFSDDDLLQDDVAAMAEPPISARDDAEVLALFAEGAGGDASSSLSFEQLAGISEIASLIAEGELAEEELRDIWDSVPKEGDAIGLESFRAVLASIDDLFEPVDEPVDGGAREQRFIVPPGSMFNDVLRGAVRKAIRKGRWKLRLTDAGQDPQVRPPENLPGGAENPLCVLGECGGNVCPLNRLRDGCENVRPEFLDFCVRSILEKVDCSEGIIYASLGCGKLYFDWELLERLVHTEGVKVKEAWLVEQFGMEYKETNVARVAFASWFSEAGIDVRAFHSPEYLAEWLRESPSADKAHVLLECDTEYIVGPEVQTAVVRPGGVHLILTQELDEWGGRSVVRTLYQKPVEDPKTIELLERKTLVDGSWAPAPTS